MSNESAGKRAKRMIESIMRTMTQFGSPRPIPPEHWFESEIREAEQVAARKAREERDLEWSLELGITGM